LARTHNTPRSGNRSRCKYDSRNGDQRRSIRTVIDRHGPPADDAGAPSDALPGNRVTTGETPSESPASARAEADLFERSAHRHDHEASLHDRLAAGASGWLYFGFL